MSENKPPSRKSDIRWRIFGHTSVVLPLVGAGIALTASFIVAPVALGITAAVGGVTGIGMGLYRLMFGAEKITEEIAGEEARQRQIERQIELDQLRNEQIRVESERDRDIFKLRDRLRQDNDTRDDKLLDRLCVINGGFSDDQIWYKALNSIVRERVRETFQSLFDDAISRLRKATDLRDQAGKLEDSALAPLREAREQLLKDVAEIVEHMARVLGGIQTLGIRSIADEALSCGDPKEQMMELDAILIGAQVAHDSFSPIAKERKQEALRQRIRSAREASLDSDTTKSGEDKERV